MYDEVLSTSTAGSSDEGTSPMATFSCLSRTIGHKIRAIVRDINLISLCKTNPRFVE